MWFVWICILGTTIQGADQLLNDLEIKPASSNCLVLLSTKFWYFSGIVYCFTNTGLPSVTCTSRVCKLVLPTSVEDLEIILPNLYSSIFNTISFPLICIRGISKLSVRSFHNGFHFHAAICWIIWK